MLCLAQRAHATHIRAGNILTQRLTDLRYRFILIVYTNRVAVDGGVDDPTATLDFGDGTSLEQPRDSKRLIRNDTYENIYYFEHTYPGTGSYRVGYTESNRNGSIKNIGNSINTPFYIESLVSVVSGVSVVNYSPTMAIPPLDKAQKGKLYVYNPGAYDIEGDSISYRLVTPKQAAGVDVSGYFTPDNMTLNSVTGDLVWDVPQEEGLFNVAFYVEEWRNGIRIGYVTRDMQIEVLPAKNDPPELSKGLDTCVVAGDTLIFEIEATDPNNHDVRITSTAPTGVYQLGATFTNPPPFW
ncbi:MAG: T9SS C-terminal target domain-containing protein [Sporocytophaga sp.]|nr:T9SS C-terminal target domain-containing protein [Sporocytophaga sp.]